MIVFLVIALILIVVVFGVSSTMYSYSSAQQAQATIETAKATQMAVFGNVVVIVVVAIFMLAILAAVIYVGKMNRDRYQINAPVKPQRQRMPVLNFADRKQVLLPSPHGEFNHEVRFIELDPEQMRLLEEELWALLEEEEQL